MKIRLFNIILPLLLLSGLNTFAQVEFKASVNRPQIGKSERFQLSFTVNAEGERFQAPELADFKVLSGPNRSTSMRIVNFERSVENTYSYVLMPRKSGEFIIGPASIKVKGETYFTESITIKVTEQSPRGSDPNDPYARAEQQAFFRILSSKTTVYQGEPFVASYKLYFSTGVSRPEVVNEPSFTGFYKSPLEINRISTRTESYRGNNYNTGIIRQLVLIPQQTGSMEPGTVDLRIPTEIPTNQRDIFGRRLSRTVVQSASREFPGIRVLPLPERGKPSSFTGAVGNYKLDVSVSRNELTTDESLTLRVSISGKGNVKLTDLPEPEIPSAFEAYDPKYSEKISVNASGMSGSKTHEYLLIPRYGGTYKIPEIQFSYFDPERKQYRTLRSKPLEVTVQGGKGKPQTEAPTTGITYQGKEKVDFINEDILFIKTDFSDVRKSGKGFYRSTSFILWLIILVLAWGGLVAVHIFRKRRYEDQKLLKSRQAGRKARKHLATAKKALGSDNREEFYSALSAALWGYFSDKFQIPGSKLSKEAILDNLQQKQLDESTVNGIAEIMNRAEMARYTTLGGNNPGEDYELAASLLTDVENNL